MMTMPIHNGSPETSPRLAGALQLLQLKGQAGATTLEIQRATCDMAPGTTISELRNYARKAKAPWTIGPARFEGLTDGRRKVYRYTLAPVEADGQVVIA